MAHSYQIMQERYPEGATAPLQDEHPVLFSTIEEAREAWDGRGRELFVNPDPYADYYIIGLDRRGVMTGETENLVNP